MWWRWFEVFNPHTHANSAYDPQWKEINNSLLSVGYRVMSKGTGWVVVCLHAAVWIRCSLVPAIDSCSTSWSSQSVASSDAVKCCSSQVTSSTVAGLTAILPEHGLAGFFRLSLSNFHLLLLGSSSIMMTSILFLQCRPISDAQRRLMLARKART